MYAQNNNPKPGIAAIVILLAVFAANAAAVIVSVDAPEYVSNSSFDAAIRIDQVEDMDSGQLDISFNSSVLNVTDIMGDIKNGEIGGREVPVENRYFMGEDTIRLLFNLPGVSGVSGSGSLATIVFEVVGNDGDTSFLDLSDGLLVNNNANMIGADWICGMVNIGDEVLPPVPSPAEYIITVYVKNIDDDRLDIHLLIDGADEGFESISSGRAEKYGDYDLEEGVHRFTIRWFDTDTGELYEKIEEHNITGATTIMLRTDEHDEDGDGVSTHVYVKNLDDDRLDAHLYIDESFKDFEGRISPGYTREFGRSDGYKLTEENHTFRIEWYDPDTEQEHQVIKECLVTGDGASVTLYIEKHDKISTHVYVMNLDDDCLDVYLYIDEFFKDFADRVSPGYTREFDESDGYKLTEGNHTFRIEWYDPDTGEEHQTTRECLITRDVAVTLYTERHDGGWDTTVNVTVNAPEFVSETFNVTIDVTDVTDLCGAQFDLTFDPDVIDVGCVEPGMIDDREMPIMYRMMEDGRLMILIFDFDLIKEAGVSGPGYLAKITFDVVGDAGGTSAIDFCESDAFMRKLVDRDGEMIDANWSGATVTVGTATSIETSSCEISSPPAVTAGAQGEARGTPTKAVSDASSERDEPQDIITAHNFLSTYALIGCSSHPYTWWITE
ncbi:MAG: cohesin domain-containing protein [Euryarchaeota archaeon]|nr:cohesin domain-containing protein [Euryarchaeota archaeon]